MRYVLIIFILLSLSCAEIIETVTKDFSCSDNGCSATTTFSNYLSDNNIPPENVNSIYLVFRVKADIDDPDEYLILSVDDTDSKETFQGSENRICPIFGSCCENGFVCDWHPNATDYWESDITQEAIDDGVEISFYGNSSEVYNTCNTKCGYSIYVSAFLRIDYNPSPCATDCSSPECQNNIEDYCKYCLNGITYTSIWGTTACCSSQEDIYIHTFNQEDTQYISLTRADNRIIISYSDNTNTKGYAISAYNSGTPVFGEEKQFENSATASFTSIAYLGNDLFVIGYRSNNRGKAIAGTLSGTTISYSNLAEFNNDNTEHISLSKIDSSHFLIIYRDIGNNNMGTAIVGTVNNGQTLSFGEEYIFGEVDGGPAHRSVYSTMLNNSFFIAAYRNADDGNKGYAVIGKINADYSIEYITSKRFCDNPARDISIAAFNETRFIIAYLDENAGLGKAIVGKISDSTIEFGNPFTFFTDIATYISVSTFNSTHFIISYRDDDGNGRLFTGYISETNIYELDSSGFNSGDTDYIRVITLSPLTAAVAYRDISDFNKGKIRFMSLRGGSISYGATIAGCGTDGYRCLPDGSLVQSYCGGSCSTCEYGLCVRKCDGSLNSCTTDSEAWCIECANGNWISSLEKCCASDPEISDWDGAPYGCCHSGIWYYKNSEGFCNSCVNGYWSSTAEKCCFPDAESYDLELDWCDIVGKTGACISGNWDPECSDGMTFYIDDGTPPDISSPHVIIYRKTSDSYDDLNPGFGVLELKNSDSSDFFAIGNITFINASLPVLGSIINDNTQGFEIDGECDFSNHYDNIMRVSDNELFYCAATDTDNNDIGDNARILYSLSGMEAKAEIWLKKSCNPYCSSCSELINPPAIPPGTVTYSILPSIFLASTSTYQCYPPVVYNLSVGDEIYEGSDVGEYIVYTIPLTKKYCEICDTSGCDCDNPTTCSSYEFCVLCYTPPADTEDECKCVYGYWDDSVKKCCASSGTPDFCSPNGMCVNGIWKSNAGSQQWCERCGNNGTGGIWSVNDSRCCSKEYDNWCGEFKRCENAALYELCDTCYTCSLGSCSLNCSSCLEGSEEWCKVCGSGEADSSEILCKCNNINNTWMNDSAGNPRCCGDDGLEDDWSGENGAVCQDGRVVYTQPWCGSGFTFYTEPEKIEIETDSCAINIYPVGFSDTESPVYWHTVEKAATENRYCMESYADDGNDTDIDISLSYKISDKKLSVIISSYTVHPTYIAPNVGFKIELEKCLTQECAENGFYKLISGANQTSAIDIEIVEPGDKIWCEECMDGVYAADSSGNSRCCGIYENESWCSPSGFCGNGSWYSLGSDRWCENCVDDGDISEIACSCFQEAYWDGNLCCGDDSTDDTWGGNNGCCENGQWVVGCDPGWCENNPELCEWCASQDKCELNWCSSYQDICEYCYSVNSTDICEYCDLNLIICENCLDTEPDCELGWCYENQELCSFPVDFKILSPSECFSEKTLCSNIKEKRDICKNNIDNDTYFNRDIFGQSVLVDGFISDLEDVSTATSAVLSPDKQEPIDMFIAELNKLSYKTKELLSVITVLKNAGINTATAIATLEKAYTILYNIMIETCYNGDFHNALKYLDALELRINMTRNQITDLNISDSIDKIVNYTSEIAQTNLEEAKNALDTLEFLINNTYSTLLTDEEISEIYDNIVLARENLYSDNFTEYLSRIKIPDSNIETVMVLNLTISQLSNDELIKSLGLDAYNQSVLEKLQNLDIVTSINDLEIKTDKYGRKYTVIKVKIKNRANTRLSDIRLPYKLPGLVGDISETLYRDDLDVVDPDPLVVWNIDEIDAGEDIEFEFVVKTEICESGDDCSDGEFCANIINGKGLCKSTCKGCGTLCDTGKPEEEICDSTGKCVVKNIYPKESPCSCDLECETGYCIMNTCCSKGEYANPYKHTCSKSPTLFRNYQDIISLGLGDTKIIYLKFYNIYNKTVVLYPNIPKQYSQYVRVANRITLLPSEQKNVMFEFIGLSLGTKQIEIYISNEDKSIDERLIFTLYTTTTASPLGVPIKTANDTDIPDIILLIILSSLFLQKSKGKTLHQQ